MRAMVFAAGYGSRLGEITKKRPKCLVAAGGKTMLEHVLMKLSSFGVREVMVNLFYLGREIREFVEEKEEISGLKIYFSEEETLLGTGGGLKRVQSFFENEEHFFIYNSDVYCDISLSDMLTFHQRRNAIVSLGVMDRSTTRPLLFDQTDGLAGWENTEKNIGEVFGSEENLIPLAFSGVQVVSSRIFPYLRDEKGQFSTIRVFLKAARAGERVLAFRMDDSYWIDVGTPEKLEELKRLLGPRGEME